LFLQNVAVGLYFCREYEAAAEAANRAIRLAPHYPNTYRWLAAALGQLGRTAEAGEAPQKAIAVAPAVFEMYVRQRQPWFRPEDYAHMLDGLHRPGCWSSDRNPDNACGNVYRHARTLPVSAVELWRKSRPLISTFPSSVN
jgi:tetratricopeptide (TPR) repeat protein